MDRFIFVLWKADSRTDASTIGQYLQGYSSKLIPLNHEEFSPEIDCHHHNDVRRKYVAGNEWYVICDLDEFHCLRGFPSFDSAVRIAESEKCEYVRTTLLDRLSDDGEFPEVLDFSRSLGDQFPLGAQVTDNIINGCTSKVCLARSDVVVQPGHHFCLGRASTIEGTTHHFKWWGSFLTEQSRRAQLKNAITPKYKSEIARLRRYIKENRGRISVQAKELNCYYVVDDPAQIRLPTEKWQLSESN